ncbi:universal stress protein PHOS32-like isoform X2 [Ananas comosus]|uniref:Universal stress protein PHOS32-like isoform X2 n=1 Tax=Ananas comosus TaxID=4615 RepID=A0A6P5FMR5_ANACO|nr:universal stress protein PHOS32-like isoform X2 [Ananas comosus]
MAMRNVGVAVDFSPCSKAALRWASTNLVRSGDRLVLVYVNTNYQIEQGVIHLWEQNGSPFIPLNEFSDPSITKRYGVSPDNEALEILGQAYQKGVEVVAKIYWGDPTKKLCEAIEQIPLHCLVVGNRGLSKIKRFIYTCE